MKDVYLSASRLQTLLVEADLPHCFIGGVAVQRWGEVRVTKDADAAVHADLGREQEVLDLLQSRFDFRVQRPLEMVKVHRVVLLVDTESGVGLDLSLAASGFEHTAIGRASTFDFGEGVQLRTCSAEDLILYKAVADREIDWHDIRGILIRQGGALDFATIDQTLAALVQLKEEPAIYDRWLQISQRHR